MFVAGQKDDRSPPRHQWREKLVQGMLYEAKIHHRRIDLLLRGELGDLLRVKAGPTISKSASRRAASNSNAIAFSSSARRTRWRTSPVTQRAPDAGARKNTIRKPRTALLILKEGTKNPPDGGFASHALPPRSGARALGPGAISPHGQLSGSFIPIPPSPPDPAAE